MSATPLEQPLSLDLVLLTGS